MSVIIKQEPPLDIPLISIPVQEAVLPPPASEPVPFCTLCLRESTNSGDYYECNQQNSSDFCTSVRDIVGIELKWQSFNICKTCWKMVQMIGDFRKCCIKGQRWLEQFERGLGCEDDWRSEELVQSIDYLQMVIEDHGKQFEESESAEEELVTTMSIDEIKVQPNDEVEEVATREEAEYESNCSEEIMEQESSEDENLLQEIPSVIHDANDEEAEAERSCNQIVHNKTINHEIQTKDYKGITVKISKQEVRDQFMNTLIAIFDSQSKMFRCEICKSNHSDRNSLKYHLKTSKHQVVVKELKLNKGVLVNISRREIHDPLLDKITAFFDYEAKINRCIICDTSYTKGKCLRLHLRTLKHQLQVRELRKKVTKSRDRKKLAPILPAYKCPMCPARLHNKNSLAVHINVVHSEPQFECHYCGEKFKKKYSIKRHLFNQHMNPKQFACTECRQVFWEARTLENHMTIHGKRPFQCDKCEKGYYRRNLLTLHKRKKH